jgi:hypothetical protein
MAIVYDLQHPSPQPDSPLADATVYRRNAGTFVRLQRPLPDNATAIAEVLVDDLTAREMCERDPTRYVRTLPPGAVLGPFAGSLNRIIL